MGDVVSLPLVSPSSLRDEPVAVVQHESLERLMGDGLDLIELRLSEECRVLGEPIPALADVLGRAIGTEGRGGGRWRPLLTLAGAEACGGSARAALDLAVAVELTHTASLVLDDLPCMDDAEERRGQPAAHRLVGSAGAILLSVGLLARAMELLGANRRCGGALCADWGSAVGLHGMAGGQAMDVAASGGLRGAARRLHRTKSTVLPAFALSAGARSAGAGDATRAGLESFGRFVGWAYQLVDDVHDLDEDQRLGRAPGGTRPLAQSRRILRQALRRVRGVPGLSDEGIGILAGLAERIVGIEPAPLGPARNARQGRD